MLTALAVFEAVRAAPTVRRHASPIMTASQAASCNDPSGCRTLWEITWSCLFTLLLCVWVSVHPNIPATHERWPKVALRRFGLMLAALIAPELIIAWAIRQRILAHELADKYREAHGWTVTHGFFAGMGGFMEYNGNEPVRTLLPDQLDGYSLTGTGDFPRIAIEEIQDKSKGDAISKGLVILQTGWFIMQCIARGIQRLPITELELVTIAFAGLNFVMYWLWWDKPLDVQRAVRVYRKRDPNEPSTDGPVATNEPGFWLSLGRSPSALPSAIALELEEWKDRTGMSKWTVVGWPIYMFDVIRDGRNTLVGDGKRIHTFYPSATPHSSCVTWVVGLSLAAVFGAIHCIAWSFVFPSDAERTLWRISSAAIIGLPFALLLVPFLVGNEHLPKGFWGVLIFSGFFVYFLSRGFLLVLPFLSLRALTREAYLSVDWTALIPHVL